LHEPHSLFTKIGFGGLQQRSADAAPMPSAIDRHQMHFGTSARRRRTRTSSGQ